MRPPAPRRNSVHPGETRVTAVVLTHNRVDELLRTLQRLVALPERPAIVVVDNASTDGTRERVAECFPDAGLVALPCNMGAAGRNAGARHARTPYVAFCDDDTWWAPGSLTAAGDLLDAHPTVAVLCARVLVGAAAREDPTCAAMAHSPLPSVGLPGRALMGFLAGACVVRRAAFLEAGGYEPRLFLGGEESLLTLDLSALGWHVVYAPALTVYHHPSPRRDGARRQGLLLRNDVLVAWLRRPVRVALHKTWHAGAACLRQPRLLAALTAALRALPWALRRRRVIPGVVEGLCRQTERQRPRPPRRP